MSWHSAKEPGQSQRTSKVNTHSTVEALPAEYDRARAEPQRSKVKSEAAQACSTQNIAQAKHSQETARAQAETTTHTRSEAEQKRHSKAAKAKQANPKRNRSRGKDHGQEKLSTAQHRKSNSSTAKGLLSENQRAKAEPKRSQSQHRAKHMTCGTPGNILITGRAWEHTGHK